MEGIPTQPRGARPKKQKSEQPLAETRKRPAEDVKRDDGDQEENRKADEIDHSMPGPLKKIKREAAEDHQMSSYSPPADVSEPAFDTSAPFPTNASTPAPTVSDATWTDPPSSMSSPFVKPDPDQVDAPYVKVEPQWDE